MVMVASGLVAAAQTSTTTPQASPVASTMYAHLDCPEADPFNDVLQHDRHIGDPMLVAGGYDDLSDSIMRCVDRLLPLRDIPGLNKRTQVCLQSQRVSLAAVALRA